MKRRLRLNLYVITDASLSKGRGHEEVARRAARSGADILQLRDKEMTTAQMVATAVRMRQIARDGGIPFIVNDRVDVALAAEADGVHVGQEDMPCALARRLLGPGRIVGVSVSSPSEAVRAEHDGADYVAVGPIYATASKADAGEPTGVGLIREIRQAVDIPIVAIGGINASNVEEVIRAGADGVAVISAVVAADDVAAATRNLAAAIRKAKGQHAEA